MAKSKAKSKKADDEEILEEADAEPVDVEEEPEDVEAEVEEEPEDVEAAVEEEPEDVEAEIEDEPEPEEDEPEERVAKKPAPPKTKLTMTVIILILLNWVMAPAFLIMASMDHAVRLQYSYRTLLNYIAVWGLPLQSEEEFASISNETRPRIRLSPKQLQDVFKSRKGTVPFSGEFAPVEEPMPLRLRPSDLIPELTEDIFGTLPGGPVATLEDEINRLKTQLPKDIEAAADEVLKKQKDDGEKRAIVQKTLLTMASDVWQVKNVNKLLSATKDGAELDELVKDSVQRRIYYDILAPLNVFRPGDLKKFDVEKIAEVEEVAKDQFKLKASLAQVKEQMQQRLSAAVADSFDTKVHLGGDFFDANVKRDSVEKRQKIGFLLFTLSQVEKPTLGEKLYKKGVERAQTVCGLHEFTNATIQYVRTLRVLEDRIIDAVVADREGKTINAKGAMSRLDGYNDWHEAQVDRLVIAAAQNEAADKRLKDLTKRKDQVQAIHDQRKMHHTETMDKLLKARKNTEKYMKELRELQDQLHEALVELSDAADRNFRLEKQIRAIETEFIKKNTPKGGKQR